MNRSYFGQMVRCGDRVGRVCFCGRPPGHEKLEEPHECGDHRGTGAGCGAAWNRQPTGEFVPVRWIGGDVVRPEDLA